MTETLGEKRDVIIKGVKGNKTSDPCWRKAREVVESYERRNDRVGNL